MKVIAVVPVKSLEASKRRLSAVFDPHAREMLTVAMLEAVLKSLSKSVVHEIVVVSDDSTVQQAANRLDASCISAERMGLNSAIEEATEWCIWNHADSVLILPADIPLVSPNDINTIVKLGSERNTLVLSPSADGGTNAFLRNPPNLMLPRFGPDSFINHVGAARSKGIRVRFYFSLGIALDIDSVEDLDRLLGLENSAIGKRLLEQSPMFGAIRRFPAGSQ